MALPEPIRERIFQRHGLGWRYRPVEIPYVLYFDRVVEQRDGTWAELHVTLADGIAHVTRRRVNLLGGTSLSGCLKDLAELTPGDVDPKTWKRVLTQGCESTLQAFRAGDPIETLSGEITRPAGVSWVCEQLVMANVVNAWIGAASAGKSTLAVALAVHHALGEPFLGFKTLKGVPLYLDYESDADDFREKVHDVARWLEARNVPPIHRQRMKGPLKHRVHDIANKIDRLGVTLLIVDAVASAGGSMGDGNYESIAIDLEQALIALPPVTVLLLDHVSGDDFKTGTVALKARGAQRKYEFVRNQWSLSRDRDASDEQRHLVGFTHAKINRGSFFPPFAVEVLHKPPELGFRPVDALDVAPTADAMNQRQRLALILQRSGPIDVKTAATELLGRDDEKACTQVRTIVSRDKGRLIVKLPMPDGRIMAKGYDTTRARPDNVTPFKPPVTPAEGDDDDLPF